MTAITINLPDDRAKRLKDEAARRGVAPEELARAGVEQLLDTMPKSSAKRSDMLAKARKRPAGSRPVTDDEIERLKHERRMRHLA